MSLSPSSQEPKHSLRRRWLCVAYAFPPMNRSGTHRTLSFVRHLFEFGWDATVLTCETDGESLDETLLSRVPPTTRILRTKCRDLVAILKQAFPKRRPSVSSSASKNGVGDGGTATPKPKPKKGFREWVTQLLKTPDSRIGWIPSAVSAGMRAVRNEKPDVIYSTSPYASAHLIAMIIQWRTRLPWVADFRDPWGDNPFHRVPFKSLRRLDAWLERLVLKRASHVVMNTEAARDALCERFTWCTSKATTIINGIDTELFDRVVPRRVLDTDCFALTHCGDFYGPRTPLPWFQALQHLQRNHPNTARRLRFVLVGDENYEGRPLRTIADEYGLGDLVVVLGKKTHRESIAMMAGSDALALITQNGGARELQIPNKLYEYLGARKPIVAALAPQSPTRKILDKCYPNCWCGNGIDPGAIADAIFKCVTCTRDSKRVDATALQKLGRANQAGLLANLFDQLIGGKKGIASSNLKGCLESGETNQSRDRERAGSFRDEACARILPTSV